MTQKHEPTEEFVEHLEWQLGSEWRRQSRFPQPGSRWGAIPNWLRIAALVVLSVFVGVAGVKAAEHYGNSLERELQLARVQTARDLSLARTQMIEEWVSDLRQDSSVLEEHPENVMFAELELVQARHQLALAELDLAEVELVGRNSGEDLTARRSSGRDFVSERILQNIDFLQQRRQMLGEYFHRQQAKPGEKNEYEAAMVEAELERLDSQTQRLERRLQLRRQFLNNEIEARRLIAQERLRASEVNLAEALAHQRVVNRQLELIRASHAGGEASKWDLRRIELEVSQAEAQLRLARLEHELLSRRLP